VLLLRASAPNAQRLQQQRAAAEGQTHEDDRSGKNDEGGRVWVARSQQHFVDDKENDLTTIGTRRFPYGASLIQLRDAATTSKSTAAKSEDITPRLRAVGHHRNGRQPLSSVGERPARARKRRTGQLGVQGREDLAGLGAQEAAGAWPAPLP
jgi:hypothetical protein